MDQFKIYDSDFFYSGLGFFYRYLTKRSILTLPHSHNFYEYFFVISGNVYHMIDGQKELLEQGDCFFIRPDDYHGYDIGINDQFELINMNISATEMDHLGRYIGKEALNPLLSNKKTPRIKLSTSQLQGLVNEHEIINFYSGNDDKIISYIGDKGVLTAHLRMLLSKVVSIFLKQVCSGSPEYINGDPSYKWLRTVMMMMNNLDYVNSGIPAFLELSGYSHGHLCLLMKKYFDITPLEFISDLRLNCAANLLENSNFDVKTIAKKVGYSSASHFITSFKNKYDMTPYHYHKSLNKYNHI